MNNRTIKELKPYVTLKQHIKTGIAFIEDGTNGNGHSAHPNIDQSGSISGMKKRGYWGKDDQTVRCNGLIYNVSVLAVHDDYDKIAADHCACEGCKQRKKNRRNQH